MQFKLLTKQFWTGQRLLLLAFLIVHTVLGVIFIKQQEITFDEPGYINYSKRWLKGHSERVVDIDDSKTPLVAVVWLPRIIKQVIHPGYQANDMGIEDMKNARYVMLIFLWLIVAYVITWSSYLYGRGRFWLPIILLLTDPLIMTYSLLINSDIVSAFVLLASLFHFYRYTATRRLLHFWLTAVFTGLALATKQGFLFLPAVLLSIYLVRKVVLKEDIAVTKRILLKGAGFLFVLWLILNGLFFFKNTFQPLGQHQFISHSLHNLQAKLHLLRAVPVLLPSPYLQAVDMLQYHAEIGPGYLDNPFPGVYIFGKYSTNGIWYYYPAIAAFKLPIGLLMLIVLTLLVTVKSWRNRAFGEKYIFLLVPIAIYLLLMSFFNPFQIGIRHALIFFPLAYLGIGYIVTKATNKELFLVAVLIMFNVISVAVYYPDLIPYTNEFISDKKEVHNYTFDTSIDYGQADTAYKSFVKTSDFRFPGGKPDTGRFIIPARFVMDKWDPLTTKYRWLLPYKPIRQYKHIYLLYDIRTVK